MIDVHLLDRPQLRLLAHPLRQRILGLLCGDELSTALLVEHLDNPPSNLYYHVDRLREAGLIRVVRHRRVRGTIERYYRAVARSFTAPPSLLQTSAGSGEVALVSAVQAMAHGAVTRLAESMGRGVIGSGPGQVVPMITSLTVRTSPERFRQLQQRLARCLRDFQTATPPKQGPTVEYALFEMLFPLAAPTARSRKLNGP